MHGHMSRYMVTCHDAPSHERKILTVSEQIFTKITRASQSGMQKCHSENPDNHTDSSVAAARAQVERLQGEIST